MLPKLFAIILVAHEDSETLYVKRSLKMVNYPGVWSLPSLQFNPAELPDPSDLFRVQPLVEKLARERFDGAAIRLEQYLTSGESEANPIERHVYLHVYQVRFVEAPRLNPEFYTAVEWMTAEEFERASADQTCGLCVRLWADYAWLTGLTDRPYSQARK